MKVFFESKFWTYIQLLILSAVFIAIATTTFMQVNSDSAIEARHIALFLFLAINTVAATVGFSVAITLNLPETDTQKYSGPGASICFTAIMLSVIQMLDIIFPIDYYFYFYSNIFLNLLLTFNIVYLVTISIDLEKKWPIYIALAPTMGIFLITILTVLNSSWDIFEELLVIIPVVKFLSMTTLPLLAISLHYIVPSTRACDNLKDSLKITFTDFNRNPIGLHFFYFYSFYGLIALLTAIWVINSNPIPETDKIDATFPIQAISLAFLPFLWLAYRKQKALNQTILENRILAGLCPDKTHDFLLRNKKGNLPWAMTVGMRTANFIIDHDPQGIASSNLTITFAQIRKEEIQKFVEQTLGPQLLSHHTTGNQIYGTIDPEHSTRTCVDVLLLLTCMYIDAIPLVERRLKTLASLLPIIDPKLSKVIYPYNIEEYLSKMEWLFYFDYNWIDQQATQQENKTNYYIHINDISVINRNNILTYLQSNNRTGNFIWIGEKARNRILMEAPYLASIIETWPIPVKTDNRSDESETIFVYLIRFEELIPRLQKYYALEEVRRKVRDYDERIETRRLMNMLELQLSNSHNQNTIINILETISNYPLKGFKEKDHALKLIIQCYNKILSLYPKDKNDGELTPQHRNKF